MSAIDHKNNQKSSTVGEATPLRFICGKAPIVDKAEPKKARTFADDIAELRNLLHDGQVGLAYKKIKENGPLLPIAVAALSDDDLAIAGNAEWLIMQAAAKGTPGMKEDLRGHLRAFFGSRWMMEQKAAGSSRYGDITEELGKVLAEL